MNDFFLNKQIHEDRATTARGTLNSHVGNERVLYIGKVISVDDNMECMRITARIAEFDNNVSDTNLSYCYPLHGQIFRIFPKVGESVMIMISNLKNPYDDRVWLFPIIRSRQNINEDSSTEGNGFIGIAGYYEKNIKSLTPLSAQPNTNGILPDKNSVSIIGRNNSDITLGNNNLMLRANYVNPTNINTLNTTNPAYLIMNYNQSTKKTTNVLRADNILLLSHNGNPNFNKVMSEDDIEIALQKCHVLPYGDILVPVLKLMAKAIVNHYHPYPSEPPIKDDTISSVKEFNYDSILSKNIKIN